MRIIKAIRRLIIIGLSIPLLILIFLYLSIWVFPELWGSYSLGSNLYLVKTEKDESILFLTDHLDGRVCDGGIDVLSPIAEYTDTNFVRNSYEYVVKSAHNEKWILVKTRNSATGLNRYYAIFKNFDSSHILKSIDDLESQLYEHNNWNLYCQRIDSLIYHSMHDDIYMFNDSTEFVTFCKSNKILKKLMEKKNLVERHITN